MSEATTQTAAEKVIYDPAAKNKFAFEIKANGGVYDLAVVFNELTDERYLRWIKDFNVTGSEDEVSESSREASAALWDDIVAAVENIEYDEGADWKSLIDPQDKIDSLNQLLAVAIADGEKRTGKLRLGVVDTIAIKTEAFFNGEILEQTHTLRPKTIELEKKYVRIQSKRFKEEKVGGSLKRKKSIRYVPQDEAIGQLYDEIAISVEGFPRPDPMDVPLRFKTAVIHEMFASRLDPKK